MAKSGQRCTRLFRWTALALLVCAALVIVQESFVHTDDGCAVEIHCLACRWAYSADAASVEAPIPTASHETFEPAPVEVDRRIGRPAVDVPTSRGPPAA